MTFLYIYWYFILQLTFHWSLFFFISLSKVFNPVLVLLVNSVFTRLPEISVITICFRPFNLLLRNNWLVLCTYEKHWALKYHKNSVGFCHRKQLEKSIDIDLLMIYTNISHCYWTWTLLTLCTIYEYMWHMYFYFKQFAILACTMQQGTAW